MPRRPRPHTPAVPTGTAPASGMPLPLYAALTAYAKARRSLLERLSARTLPRSRTDYQGWREAYTRAQAPDRPDPGPLLDLYAEALLDGHLASVVSTRKIRILGAQRTWVAPSGSRPADSPWVHTLLEAVLDARFWGHSAVELGVGTEGEPTVAQLPPRHLLPAQGLVRLEAQAPAPPVGQAPPPGYLPLAQLPQVCMFRGDGLGLLNPAVPLVLVKRHALASWSEFVELFGIPLRIGRTPSRDQARKQELAEVLKTLGSAAYAVLEDGEAIEFQENQKGDTFRVFDRLVERCNLELSKLINGQTLTTEQGDRGARSLGEIHDRVFDSLTRADVRWLETQVNHTLLPRLAQLPDMGAWANVRLRINHEATVLSLAEQWQIDRGLLEHFRLDPSVLAQRYGTPILAER
ncbi:MAG: DUF935 family protein [Bacteroidia bacterium]|nr:DUF935 family protein [Bacteroidia bacterium]